MKRLLILLLLAGFVGLVDSAHAARDRAEGRPSAGEAEQLGVKLTIAEFEGSYLDSSGRPTVLCDQVLPKANGVAMPRGVSPQNSEVRRGI